MKISSEKLENSQVSLNIEMEGGESDKYFDIALDHIAKNISLPGFRKGKAPKILVEQQVGKQALFQEALEHLIPEVYEQALKQESIDAIAEPHIELVTMEPIAFKAVVPVKPTVTLGNYREIRLEMQKKEVSDPDIDQVIEQLRHQFGSLLPAERPVQYNDVISMDLEGTREDKTILSRKDALYDVQQDSKYPFPGFSAKILGASKGDQFEFPYCYPEDSEFKELAGKEYKFCVKVNEVKQKDLPEVNDEFAQKMGNSNLEELRDQIKASMQARANEQLRKTLEHDLFTRLIEQSEVVFPPVLVEKEIDHLIEEEARGFSEGIKGLENYLKNLKKTIEQHREDVRPQATSRVKAYLIVGKIAEQEKISVSEDELNQAIDDMAKGDEGKAENIRAVFNLGHARESLRDMLLVSKTVDMLLNIVTGQEPILTD